MSDLPDSLFNLGKSCYVSHQKREEGFSKKEFVFCKISTGNSVNTVITLEDLNQVKEELGAEDVTIRLSSGTYDPDIIVQFQIDSGDTDE